MKKRIVAFILLTVTLVSCACSANPVDTDGKIISSNDVKLVATEEENIVTQNIICTEKISLRDGEWGDMTWREIMDKRTALGQIKYDYIVIKNGLNTEPRGFNRVGLFKYDISGLSLEDIGTATFNVTLSDIDKSKDIPFDIYWVDENWDPDTVTWNTKPDFLMEEPIIDNMLTGDLNKTDATEALKLFVASGKKEVSLMMVQTVMSDAESRICFFRSNELSFPYFAVYKDLVVGEGGYVERLVSDPQKNQAIWDHAKKMFDEWYERYTVLKAEPLNEASLIVSDESQYNKTSYSPGYNPNAKEWKAYKTRTFGDLTDMSEYVDVNSEPKFDKYGGIMDDALRQEATGFYYTKKIGERWWIIDPLGYPCYIRALSGITYSYQGSPKQRAAAEKLYGNNDNYEKWAIATTRRLKDDLYFNAGATPAGQIKTVVDGLAWQGGWSYMSQYGVTKGINNSKGGATTFSEKNTMPVFDPEFEVYCDEMAATRTLECLNDSNFLGYTTDNELPTQEDLIYDYLTVSPAKEVNLYSYACAWYWLVQMTGKENPTFDDIDEELEQLFKGFVWDRYYNVVCGAIRKYDPNHMILGTRFITEAKDAPWALRFAGEYLDCITINWYNAWEPSAENIYNFAIYADIPFMVTEFYAKAEENEDNLANTSGGGFFVKTQQDRADHYQSFTLRLLEAKNCVGWHWFQYSDNDPTGNPADLTSLDANKGVYSNTLKEYTDLTDDMAVINKNVYSIIKYFDAKYDQQSN